MACAPSSENPNLTFNNTVDSQQAARYETLEVDHN